MSLSRESVAHWMWQHFGDLSESWESLSEANREYWDTNADDFAQQFKLPLDADGPGITRCRCGHPVGEHREGENACRGKSPTPRGMAECKCRKAVAREAAP